MSYAYDPIEEERRKQQQESQQLGGDSSVVGSNQPTAGQSMGSSKGSGQYVNLQNYLNTNKNPFASDLSQKVGQEISTAEEAQNKSKSEFQKASDQGTTSLDQSNIDFVTKNPYAASLGYSQDTLGDYEKAKNQPPPKEQPAPPPIGIIRPRPPEELSGLIFSPKQTQTSQASQATQQPLATTQATQQTQTPQLSVSAPKDLAQVNKFKSQRDARYLGPEQFTGSDYYNAANKAVSGAANTAQALQSDQGRKSLLQKYYGTNQNRYDYNQGQQNLDMLLFGSDPNAKNAILEQTKKAQDVSKNFQSLQEELNNYAKQNALKTANTRKAARSAIGIDDSGGFTGGGPIQQILDATQKRSKELSTKYPELVNNVTSALFNKDISGLDKATKDKLNLQDVYSLYNLDPSSSKYLSFAKPEEVTQSGVTTQDELNALASLSDLAGINQNWINPEQVGKTSGGLFNYNTDLFKKDLAAARTNFEKQRKNLAHQSTNSNGTTWTSDMDDTLALLNKYWNETGRKAKQSDFDFFNNNIVNFEKQLGARDVLKAGRENELMDLSDDLKNDILRSYIAPYQSQVSLPNFSNRGLYGNVYVSQVDPGSSFRNIGGMNEYLANENAQSSRGLQDYQYLSDYMKQQGRSRSEIGLPSITDDQLIENYKKGNLLWGSNGLI